MNARSQAARTDLTIGYEMELCGTNHFRIRANDIGPNRDGLTASRSRGPDHEANPLERQSQRRERCAHARGLRPEPDVQPDAVAAWLWLWTWVPLLSIAGIVRAALNNKAQAKFDGKGGVASAPVIVRIRR